MPGKGEPLEQLPVQPRYMSADQIAEEYFGNTVTAEWVTRNLRGPQTGRVKIGHKTIRWNRQTLEAYITTLERQA